MNSGTKIIFSYYRLCNWPTRNDILAAFSPATGRSFPTAWKRCATKKGPTNQKSGIIRQSRVCRLQESWRHRTEIEYRSGGGCSPMTKTPKTNEICTECDVQQNPHPTIRIKRFTPSACWGAQGRFQTCNRIPVSAWHRDLYANGYVETNQLTFGMGKWMKGKYSAVSVMALLYLTWRIRLPILEILRVNTGRRCVPLCQGN